MSLTLTLDLRLKNTYKLISTNAPISHSLSANLNLCEFMALYKFYFDFDLI